MPLGRWDSDESSETELGRYDPTSSTSDGETLYCKLPQSSSFFTKFFLLVHRIAILIDGTGPGILQKNLRKLTSVLIPVQMMVV